MQLIANKNFRHGGKSLHAGDTFSAHPTIGRAYTRTGYASETVSEEIDGQVYQTRVMVADVPKRKRGRPRKSEG